jgi:hypothetical protein
MASHFIESQEQSELIHKAILDSQIDTYKKMMVEYNNNIIDIDDIKSAGDDMLSMLDILPNIAPDQHNIIKKRLLTVKNKFMVHDDTIQLVKRLQTEKDDFIVHDDTIQLVVSVTADGSGDFSHIQNYIRLFNICGYKNQNITIIVCLNVCDDDRIPTSKKTSDFFTMLQTVIPYEAIATSDILKIEKKFESIVLENNIYVRDITSFLRDYDPNEYSRLCEQITIGHEIITMLDYCAYLSDDDPKVSTYRKVMLDKFDNNEVTFREYIANFHEHYIRRQPFVYALKALKNIAYVSDVTYYLARKCKELPEVIGFNSATDVKNKCVPTLQESKIIINSKNNLFITFAYSATSVFGGQYVFGKCGNIIDTSEGGHMFGLLNITDPKNDGNKYNSGVGFPFIGIYQGAIYNVREQITKKHVCRILNNMFYKGVAIITEYYMSYIGQLIFQEIITKQILKFVYYLVFICYLSKINTHVLAPYSLSMCEEKLMEILGKYFIIITVPDNNTILICTNKVNGRVITILLYRPLKNNLQKIVGDEITFQELVKCSEEPVAMTGDLSFQEAIALGKICIHDCIAWKKPMVKMFIDTLELYYEQLTITAELPNLLKYIYGFYVSIENTETDVLLVEYDIRHIILSIEMFNTNNESRIYKSFVDNYLKVYFNGDHNMCMLIYLHRNNLVFRETYKLTNISLLTDIYDYMKLGLDTQYGGYYKIYKNIKKKYLEIC